MTRAPRQRERSGDITDAAWAMLTDQPVPPDALPWEVWHLRSYPGPESHNGKLTLEGLWPLHGRAIVEQWAVEHPGTRPSLWWRWDAPRQPVGTKPGWWDDGKVMEPRLRLGGIGTPAHEVLAYGEFYKKGIPAYWVNASDEAYYNGRAFNIHGEPIVFRNRDGTIARDGDFTGRAPDPLDPPRFESQAAYLVRFNLLLPGERGRLTKADLEPEVMEVRGR